MFGEDRIIEKWNADMYDQNVTETNDIEFLLSIIGATPKRVLEVCCGSGRILVPLAKAGHIVTGFDMDESMLVKISAKAEGLTSIFWRQADAVNDDWGTGYDIVVLAGNILFNIISDMDYEKAQELFIQKAAAALTPGGYLYLDYQYFLHPDNVFGGSGERIIWEGRDIEGNFGRMILVDGSYDKETRISRGTRRFELMLANGDEIRKDIPMLKHFATLDQIHGWMSTAGLSVEQEYGDYSKNPISETTNRAIIYAKKA